MKYLVIFISKTESLTHTKVADLKDKKKNRYNNYNIKL